MRSSAVSVPGPHETSKRILIIGNLGYVGSVLTKYLRSKHPDYELVGFDNGYFANCVLVGRPLQQYVTKQLSGDSRKIDADLLAGFDAVVQLAAVSNDPMGKEFEAATISINLESTHAIAKAAAAADVPAFVFASSCSVYGVADGPPRRESDPVSPQTAYAFTKVEAERQLAELDSGMTITALRFATACGMSERLRLDLVLNDFVAAALFEGEITVLSDGSPWRPLIDVEDMARAIDWAIHRDPVGDPFLVVNTGASDHNYQVKDIAQAVASAVPNTIVSINTAAPADSRSYRVDFSLFESLAPEYLPQLSLDDSISRLVEGLSQHRFDEEDFRHSNLIRLNVLRQHIRAGRLNSELVWTAAQ